MKIKLVQISAIAYILLFFLISKTFSIFPTILLLIVFLIDYFTNLRSGIKNLLYLIAALSVFPTLLNIFMLYLPFSIFGILLTKKNFLRNYILAFALSFIPVNIIYLITTYLPIPLNYPTILFIFYSTPLIGIILLKKRALDYLEIDDKECLFIFVILIFTTVIAINIVDDKSLFIANGVRIFTRIQVANEGFESQGSVPIYNPGIAQGEATYLWNTPSFKVHAALNDYLLKPKSHIFLFNSLSFFILLLSTLSLGILFRTIINKEETTLNIIAVMAVTVLTGLNFYFLQLLESFKANYTYPIAYLFLSIILDNPKKYNDYLILMYFSVLFIIVHLPYGSGVLLIGACLFLLTKIYYLKDRSEIKSFFDWLPKNKLKFAVTITIIILLPIFYLISPFLFKDFLDQNTINKKITFNDIKSDSTNFFKGFYNEISSFLSLKYPDVNRLDDHKIGFFISIFGPISLLALFLFYKSDSSKIRMFTVAFVLNLIISALFYSKLTVLVGGFFRTNLPYTLIIMGASIVTMICLLKNKYVKYLLIAAVFIAFLHTIPYAKQNLINVHREYFASGDIYKEEIDFIRKLPIDGRILTYGLFNNAVDFGGNYLTGRYFSRDERAEFNLQRRLFEKVHGQNSFGEPDTILPKSGTELSNYLILGGYKYLFMDARHPISQYVLLELSPSFARKIYQNVPQVYISENRTNYAYPIYQNGPLIFLVINNTNYAEKVDLAKSIPDGVYKEMDGYKYTTLSPHYNFNRNLNFKEKPKEPEPLKFERLLPTEVKIFGNFEKDDFVVFKEYYFSRWKAYMNNKEVPVMATVHEMVLIRTDKGDSVLLKYIIISKEKIFGILSLISHIGLVILLIYLLRKII